MEKREKKLKKTWKDKYICFKFYGTLFNPGKKLPYHFVGRALVNVMAITCYGFPEHKRDLLHLEHEGRGVGLDAVTVRDTRKYSIRDSRILNLPVTNYMIYTEYSSPKSLTKVLRRTT